MRSSHRGLLFLFFTTFILITQLVNARTFKNAYVSFEMEDTWKCKLEQTEWVCRSEDPQEAKQAVIILTAKEKGPSDSFPIYMDHLAKPIQLKSKTGAMIDSVVTIPPQELVINDHKWINSLHTNSEVQNYYTRYVATIKDQIAILVTFTAHNKYFSKFGPNFEKTVQSLRVIAAKDLLSRPDLGPLRGSGEYLGEGVNQAMPSDLLAAEDELSRSGKRGLLHNEMFLGLVILILVAAAYVGLKIYKNK